MIENVSRSAPALVPLFRSDQQLRILAALFTRSAGEQSVGDLAEHAGVAQATASREVARLAEHGVVVTRALGRNTLVAPNWSLPWAKDLSAILAKTVGVLGRLGDELSGVPAVEEAYVFGSWAERYTGEPGPPPRDVDVVVVGGASLRAIRRACAVVERELDVEVNAVVVDRERWLADEPEPFVAQLKGRPLVPIPLERG
ncbi:MAG: winged helix-turn-helix domain-containing protein [Actinomycetota bacterium]|nr:winged helix-turn-helix domain-containing protein [Actinomycetota bacterium]